MKNKTIVLILFLLIFYNSAFSESRIIDNRASIRPSAIQSTNMVFREYPNTSYSGDTINSALTEIQNKIKANPNDYSLYVPLSELYIRTKQYEKAYDELSFLFNLSKQNKLPFSVKTEISKLQDKLSRNAKYDLDKSSLYIDMALMSLILDDKEKAENLILAASNGNVNDKMLKNILSFAFADETNPQKVINICNNLIKRNPNDLEIRKLKALYLTQTNNSDDAINEYSTIVSLSPSDFEAKYNLYKLLSTKNVSEKEIIKKLYPQNTQDLEKIYSELASMLLKNNNVAEAKKYAEALTAKFPQNETGYMVLAEIYQKEGNLKASYDALLKLKDTADSSEAIAKYNVMLAKLSDEPVKEANSLIATGLYQQALEVLESANPENLYVILTQVRANYMLSNKQQAMELLNKAMSLYPDNSDVYCAFGWVYLQEKEIDTARKYTDASLKFNPQNVSTKQLLDMVNQAESDTFMNKIISSYEAQNYSETMRLVDEALQINKKDSQLYFYKALAYIAQNNYAASTAPLYKAIELDKSNKQAYFYLALAFDNLSEQKQALEYYQQYIKLLQNDDYSETERREYALSRISSLNNQ